MYYKFSYDFNTDKCFNATADNVTITDENKLQYNAISICSTTKIDPGPRILSSDSNCG